MDIVAHPGSVRRVIVVAEDVEMRPPPHGHLGDEGHEVVRDAGRILADVAGRVSADRVEIAQQGDRPGGIGDREVLQHLLDLQLGAAIGVRRPPRVALVDRQIVRVAVDRGRGGEDEAPAVRGLQRLQQRHGAADIDVEIGERLRHRFPDRLQPGEMDDRLGPGRRHGRRHRRLVADVGLGDGEVPVRQPPDAGERFRVGVAEIVDDMGLVARGQHGEQGVAADIAGAAGYQDTHGVSPRPASVPGSGPTLAGSGPGRKPRNVRHWRDRPAAGPRPEEGPGERPGANPGAPARAVSRPEARESGPPRSSGRRGSAGRWGRAARPGPRGRARQGRRCR